MKKALLVTLIIVLLGSAVLAKVSPPNQAHIVPEALERLKTEDRIQVIVGTYDTPTTFGTSSSNRNDLAKGGFVTEVTLSELESLRNQPGVRYIEPVRTFETTLQDAVTIINASNTWNLQVSDVNITGIDQTICIIDTGINYTHPDLLGKNATMCNLNCTGASCVENCATTDLNGHGTHVAGIAAAQGTINGIAQGANVIGLKVFPGASRTGATTTGIKNAIDWCVANANTYDISAISLSLGTSSLYDDYCGAQFISFNNSINDAVAQNISVIVSTGNAGSGIPRNTTHIASPACIANAIPVSATDDDDSIASYGHYNTLVKLFAPGTAINSTCIPTESSTGYCTKSGTSMATPMVSGSIALLNHLLTATGQSNTPSQLETLLATTGVTVTDGTSNFSRINIIAAALESDTLAPTVTLIEPSNAEVSLIVNKTFTCNAVDWQLVNATLSIWNSTGLYTQTTQSLSGTNDSLTENITAMPYGTYTWNCEGVDAAGNSAVASTNNTFTIGGISVTLDSPTDASYTNEANQNFTCSATSEPGVPTANLTFVVYNVSGTKIYETTSDNPANTTDATLTTNYSISDEQTYSWNCLGVNNAINSSYASANYSITYDITSPEVSLTSPADSTTYDASSQFITFAFNATDASPLNCSVYLQGSESNSTLFTNLTNPLTITQTVGEGTYVWSITCADLAGNANSTSNRTFTVEETVAASGSSSGGGGGGGGGSSSSSSSSGGAQTLPESETVESEPLPEPEPQQTPEEANADFVTTEEEPELSPVDSETATQQVIRTIMPLFTIGIIIFIAIMYLAQYLNLQKHKRVHRAVRHVRTKSKTSK